MEVDPEVVDAEVRGRCDAGDLDGALTLALDSYGDDVFGFLVGLCGDYDRAGDLFSAVYTRVWKYLAKFRWDTLLRVWMYRIARNEFLRAAGKKDRSVPLSKIPAVEALIARSRSSTPIHQRTEIKQAFAKIRESLAPEDHMLLGLRLDRKLPWTEIAEIMEVEAPALRKRFERLKARVRELMT